MTDPCQKNDWCYVDPVGKSMKKVGFLSDTTYAFDRKKAPHWVLMSGYDSNCLYLHDPDPDEARQSELDCQFIPVARHDFERMSCFGKSRLRTAVIIASPEVHGR